MTVQVRYRDGANARTETFSNGDQVSESLDGFMKVERVMEETPRKQTCDTLRIFNKDDVIWVDIE